MLRFFYRDKPTESTPAFVASLNPAEWDAQDKYDGWTAVVHIDSPTEVRIMSSDGNDLSATNARERRTVVSAFKNAFAQFGLPVDSVFNAELVGPRGNHPWGMYMWDCVAYRGRWMDHNPWTERKQIVNDLFLPVVTPGGAIQIAHTVDGATANAENPNPLLKRFEHLKTEWLVGGNTMSLTEGIVVKRKIGTFDLSTSRPGKSSHAFKIKFREIREARF